MNTLEHLNQEMAEVVAKAGGSLVEIRRNGRIIGAGSVWHPEGLIITNAHVARAGNHLEVRLPNKRIVPAQILAIDDSHDIAALEAHESDLPAIELGQSRLLRPGQMVLAIGHPWGFSEIANAGVVIGVGSEWPALGSTGRDWIAVDMPLRPGNSGGPLTDVQGKLVGINTMITGPTFGLAVPVHSIKEFLRKTIGNWEIQKAEGGREEELFVA